MHDTAYDIGRTFLHLYWSERFRSILDVGSQDVNGTLRDCCPTAAEYVGVDLQAGPNVDVVLDDPNVFPFKDGSFDVVLSTSCFEHDQMFWLTFSEMGRVLKPGGYIYINAPSNGNYHAYPRDNWRFYPDAGLALEKWANKCRLDLRLIESFTARRRSDIWNDFVAVFRKGEGPPVKSRYLSDEYPGSFNIRKGSHDSVTNPCETPEDLRLVRELKADVAARDQEIVSLNETIAEIVSAADSLAADFGEQRARADNLEADLSEKGKRIDTLEGILANRDKQIADLNGAVARRDARIDELNKATVEHGERIEALIGERDAARRTLSGAYTEMGELRRAFVTSTSWKLTAPVRALKIGPAKTVRTLRAMLAAIRFGGGVLPTARKAVRVLCQEGTAGVKWRIGYAQLSENASPAPTTLVHKIQTTLNNDGGRVSKAIDDSYMALRQDVLDSGLWDEKWYLSKYYESYIQYRRKKSNRGYLSPLDYYLKEGWKLGHEPSAALPFQIDQRRIGCSKIEYFLNRARFEGYQFDENIWAPSESSIGDYLRQKKERTSTKVIYTCIIHRYDELMQPYHVSAEWDYVCLTDDPDLIRRESIGVWEIRPLRGLDEPLSPTRRNRWHKMHPHILFPEYEESIYIDGNINILTDYIFKEIKERRSRFLLPQHFARNCVYQEIEALLKSHRIGDEEKSLLTSHRRFLERAGFPKEAGLSENNLLYRKHHDDLVVKLMGAWWDIYARYSSRDQVSLAYVFWKNGIAVRDHTHANCRTNYKDFWVVKHLPDRPKRNSLQRLALTPAFERRNVALVFSTNRMYIPYLGVAIYTLIENASDDYNYDVVVLAKGLEAGLAKISGLARHRKNVSIRIYDTTALLESLPADIFHVEGYVPIETYNKCFITEILSGYERCVYLDSDIVVLDDIQKLHDIDLYGCAVGASVNVANVSAAYSRKVIKGRRFDKYVEEELGIPEYNKYFQAGVVVLDMRRLGAMNMRQLTINALEKVKRPIFFDQCIFNLIFYGDVRFFSTAWNHVWYLQHYSYLRGSVPDDVFFDYARGRVDPKIIHYAGPAKPQNQLGWVLAEKFWQYAYASPFFDDIQKDIVEKNTDVAQVILREPGYGWSRLNPRVLVHVHLYYVDQLDVMVDALRAITDCDRDVFVTMVEKNEVAEAAILSVAKGARFVVLPNVGYDVYPFLDILKQVRLADYDLVLKVHTKNARSPGQDVVYDVDVPGYRWRDELLSALVGSEEIFRKNLTRFVEEKGLGCIGARKFIFSTEENNEEVNYSLAEWRRKCGVVGGARYVGGSMFFARAYPFERLKGLNMQPKDFEARHMQTKDHRNMAHIFERLFGIVIESEGFYIGEGDYAPPPR
jgi:lipopolysaccharide biosynthesis glycosyltransferase/SAM-dependent methyltransferase/uncharacterized coiled-coil protein SlyX